MFAFLKRRPELREERVALIARAKEVLENKENRNDIARRFHDLLSEYAEQNMNHVNKEFATEAISLLQFACAFMDHRVLKQERAPLFPTYMLIVVSILKATRKAVCKDNAVEKHKPKLVGQLAVMHATLIDTFHDMLKLANPERIRKHFDPRPEASGGTVNANTLFILGELLREQASGDFSFVGAAGEGNLCTAVASQLRVMAFVHAMASLEEPANIELLSRVEGYRNTYVKSLCRAENIEALMNALLDLRATADNAFVAPGVSIVLAWAKSHKDRVKLAKMLARLDAPESWKMELASVDMVAQKLQQIDSPKRVEEPVREIAQVLSLLYLSPAVLEHAYRKLVRALPLQHRIDALTMLSVAHTTFLTSCEANADSIRGGDVPQAPGAAARLSVTEFAEEAAVQSLSEGRSRVLAPIDALAEQYVRSGSVAEEKQPTRSSAPPPPPSPLPSSSLRSPSQAQPSALSPRGALDSPPPRPPRPSQSPAPADTGALYPALAQQARSDREASPVATGAYEAAALVSGAYEKAPPVPSARHDGDSEGDASEPEVEVKEPAIVANSDAKKDGADASGSGSDRDFEFVGGEEDDSGAMSLFVELETAISRVTFEQARAFMRDPQLRAGQRLSGYQCLKQLLDMRLKLKPEELVEPLNCGRLDLLLDNKDLQRAAVDALQILSKKLPRMVDEPLFKASLCAALGRHSCSSAEGLCGVFRVLKELPELARRLQPSREFDAAVHDMLRRMRLDANQTKALVAFLKRDALLVIDDAVSATSPFHARVQDAMLRALLPTPAELQHEESRAWLDTLAAIGGLASQAPRSVERFGALLWEECLAAHEHLREPIVWAPIIAVRRQIFGSAASPMNEELRALQARAVEYVVDVFGDDARDPGGRLTLLKLREALSFGAGDEYRNSERRREASMRMERLLALVQDAPQARALLGGLKGKVSAVAERRYQELHATRSKLLAISSALAVFSRYNVRELREKSQRIAQLLENFETLQVAELALRMRPLRNELVEVDRTTVEMLNYFQANRCPLFEAMLDASLPRNRDGNDGVSLASLKEAAEGVIRDLVSVFSEENVSVRRLRELAAIAQQSGSSLAESMVVVARSPAVPERARVTEERVRQLCEVAEMARGLQETLNAVSCIPLYMVAVDLAQFEAAEEEAEEAAVGAAAPAPGAPGAHAGGRPLVTLAESPQCRLVHALCQAYTSDEAIARLTVQQVPQKIQELNSALSPLSATSPVLAVARVIATHPELLDFFREKAGGRLDEFSRKVRLRSEMARQEANEIAQHLLTAMDRVALVMVMLAQPCDSFARHMELMVEAARHVQNPELFVQSLEAIAQQLPAAHAALEGDDLVARSRRRMAAAVRSTAMVEVHFSVDPSSAVNAQTCCKGRLCSEDRGISIVFSERDLKEFIEQIPYVFSSEMIARSESKAGPSDDDSKGTEAVDAQRAAELQEEKDLTRNRHQVLQFFKRVRMLFEECRRLMIAGHPAYQRGAMTWKLDALPALDVARWDKLVAEKRSELYDFSNVLLVSLRDSSPHLYLVNMRQMLRMQSLLDQQSRRGRISPELMRQIRAVFPQAREAEIAAALGRTREQLVYQDPQLRLQAVCEFVDHVAEQLGNPYGIKAPLRNAVDGGAFSGVEVALLRAEKFDEDRLLRLVLSLFPGRLPEYFEVLYCTEQTTHEEIELLVKRIEHFHQHRFVLVRVERLSDALQRYLLESLPKVAESMAQTRQAQEQLAWPRLALVQTGSCLLSSSPHCKEFDAGQVNLLSVDNARRILAPALQQRRVKVTYYVGSCGSGKTHRIEKAVSGRPTLWLPFTESLNRVSTLQRLLRGERTLQNEGRKLECVCIDVSGYCPLRDAQELLWDLLLHRRIVDASCEEVFVPEADRALEFHIELPGYGLSPTGRDEFDSVLYRKDWIAEDVFALAHTRNNAANRLVVAGAHRSAPPQQPAQRPVPDKAWWCGAYVQNTLLLPLLPVVSTADYVHADLPYDCDPQAYEVALYLKALRDGSINLKLEDRKVGDHGKVDMELFVKLWAAEAKQQPAAFRVPPDECDRLLREASGFGHSKLLMRAWVAFMHRRISFLDKWSQFNFNSVINNLGTTMLRQMIKEARDFVSEETRGLISTRGRLQLIYDFGVTTVRGEDEFGGVVQVFHVGNVPDDEKRPFVELQFEPEAELAVTLARSLGVPADDIRRTVQEQRYVMTKDYACKILAVHERKKSRITVVIEGETGVGKTEMLRIYSLLINNQSALVAQVPQAFAALAQMLVQQHGTPELKAGFAAWQRAPNGLTAARQLQRSLFGDDEVPTPVLHPTHERFARALVAAVREEWLNDYLFLEVPAHVRNAMEGRAIEENAAPSAELVHDLLAALNRAACRSLFNTIGVHGNMSEEEVVGMLEPIVRFAHAVTRHPLGLGVTVALFFDEVNTAACLGLFKAIMTDRRFGDLALPHNVFLVAAINPLVDKATTDAGQRQVLRGISDEEEKSVQANAERKLERTVSNRRGVNPADDDATAAQHNSYYLVRDLPPSLGMLRWVYGAMTREQLTEYIMQKLRRVDAEARAKLGAAAGSQAAAPAPGPAPAPEAALFAGVRRKRYRRGRMSALGEISDHNVAVLADLILEAHEWTRANLGDSSVSQRDLQRVFRLWNFFRLGTPECVSSCGCPECVQYAQRPEFKEPVMSVRTMVLALQLVYGLRLLPDNRRMFVSEMDAKLSRAGHALRMEAAFEQEMRHFMHHVVVPDGIVLTQALNENVFVFIACFEAIAPMLLIGKPGASKTLSFHVAKQNLLGNKSTSPFFRALKEAVELRYQGSEKSTSKEVEGVFRVALELQADAERSRSRRQCAILFDEVGLTRNARQPLKALHYYLDHPRVAFLGISNRLLDPARMNRAVVVRRSKPDRSNLIQLARGISRDGGNGGRERERVMEGLCVAYDDLVNSQLDASLRAQMPCDLSHFFGLRDFYALPRTLPRDRPITAQALSDALEHNFNGVPDAVFQRIRRIFFERTGLSGRPFDERTPLEVLQERLSERAPPSVGELSAIGCRFKLLIDNTADESVVRLLLALGVLDEARCTVVMGSPFPADNDESLQSELVSRIIPALGAPTRLVLLHCESVFDTMYDVFNQHFQCIRDRDGTHYFADVAVGARSRVVPVHATFDCVVIVKARDLASTPPPFLNRFEKYLISPTAIWAQFVHVLDDVRPFVAALARQLEDTLTRFVDLMGIENLYGGVRGDTVASLLLGMFRSEIMHSLRRGDLNSMLAGSAARMAMRAPDGAALSAEQEAAFAETLFCFPQHVLEQEARLVDEPAERISPADALQRRLARRLLILLLQIATPESLLAPRASLASGGGSASQASARNMLPSWCSYAYFALQNHFSWPELRRRIEAQDVAAVAAGTAVKKWLVFSRSTPSTIDGPSTALHLTETSFDVQQRLEQFKESKERLLVIYLTVNSRLAENVVNHVRMLIDRAIDPLPAADPRRVVLLLFFPSSSQRVRACYSAHFLGGWSCYYLDSLSPHMGRLNAEIDDILANLAAKSYAARMAAERAVQVQQVLRDRQPPRGGGGGGGGRGSAVASTSSAAVTDAMKGLVKLACSGLQLEPALTQAALRLFEVRDVDLCGPIADTFVTESRGESEVVPALVRAAARSMMNDQTADSLPLTVTRDFDRLLLDFVTYVLLSILEGTTTSLQRQHGFHTLHALQGPSEHIVRTDVLRGTSVTVEQLRAAALRSAAHFALRTTLVRLPPLRQVREITREQVQRFRLANSQPRPGGIAFAPWMPFFKRISERVEGVMREQAELVTQLRRIHMEEGAAEERKETISAETHERLLIGALQMAASQLTMALRDRNPELALLMQEGGNESLGLCMRRLYLHDLAAAEVTKACASGATSAGAASGGAGAQRELELRESLVSVACRFLERSFPASSAGSLVGWHFVLEEFGRDLAQALALIRQLPWLTRRRVDELEVTGVVDLRDKVASFVAESLRLELDRVFAAPAVLGAVRAADLEAWMCAVQRTVSELGAVPQGRRNAALDRLVPVLMFARAVRTPQLLEAVHAFDQLLSNKRRNAASMFQPLVDAAVEASHQVADGSLEELLAELVAHAAKSAEKLPTVAMLEEATAILQFLTQPPREFAEFVCARRCAWVMEMLRCLLVADQITAEEGGGAQDNCDALGLRNEILTVLGTALGTARVVIDPSRYFEFEPPESIYAIEQEGAAAPAPAVRSAPAPVIISDASPAATVARAYFYLRLERLREHQVANKFAALCAMRQDAKRSAATAGATAVSKLNALGAGVAVVEELATVLSKAFSGEAANRPSFRAQLDAALAARQLDALAVDLQGSRAMQLLLLTRVVREVGSRETAARLLVEGLPQDVSQRLGQGWFAPWRPALDALLGRNNRTPLYSGMFSFLLPHGDAPPHDVPYLARSYEMRRYLCPFRTGLLSAFQEFERRGATGLEEELRATMERARASVAGAEQEQRFRELKMTLWLCCARDLPKDNEALRRAVCSIISSSHSVLAPIFSSCDSGDAARHRALFCALLDPARRTKDDPARFESLLEQVYGSFQAFAHEAIVAVVALVLGLPRESSHLWTHLFHPGQVEGTLGGGSAYSCRVMSGSGVHFDCGTKMDENGNPLKSRPPLEVKEERYVLNMASYAAFSVSLTVFPESAQQLLKHVLSDFSGDGITLRQFCGQSTLSNFTFLLNLGHNPEESLWYVTHSLEALFHLLLDAARRQQKCTRWTEAELELRVRYEQLWMDAQRSVRPKIPVIRGVFDRMQAGGAEEVRRLQAGLSRYGDVMPVPNDARLFTRVLDKLDPVAFRPLRQLFEQRVTWDNIAGVPALMDMHAILLRICANRMTLEEARDMSINDLIRRVSDSDAALGDELQRRTEKAFEHYNKFVDSIGGRFVQGCAGGGENMLVKLTLDTKVLYFLTTERGHSENDCLYQIIYKLTDQQTTVINQVREFCAASHPLLRALIERAIGVVSIWEASERSFLRIPPNVQRVAAAHFQLLGHGSAALATEAKDSAVAFDAERLQAALVAQVFTDIAEVTGVESVFPVFPFRRSPGAPVDDQKNPAAHEQQLEVAVPAQFSNALERKLHLQLEADCATLNSEDTQLVLVELEGVVSALAVMRAQHDALAEQTLIQFIAAHRQVLGPTVKLSSRGIFGRLPLRQLRGVMNFFRQRLENQDAAYSQHPAEIRHALPDDAAAELLQRVTDVSEAKGVHAIDKLLEHFGAIVETLNFEAAARQSRLRVREFLELLACEDDAVDIVPQQLLCAHAVELHKLLRRLTNDLREARARAVAAAAASDGEGGAAFCEWAPLAWLGAAQRPAQQRPTAAPAAPVAGAPAPQRAAPPPRPPRPL